MGSGDCLDLHNVYCVQRPAAARASRQPVRERLLGHADGEGAEPQELPPADRAQLPPQLPGARARAPRLPPRQRPAARRRHPPLSPGELEVYAAD